MRQTITIAFILALFSACFHKDALKDRADDVTSAFIYSGTEGKFIITKEQVFQAQSKKSGGGVTQISGYAEYRISAYDLTTGKQTGRVNLGEGIEKSFAILGTTPGKLWVYSIDPELGFHCRNPKTLEVIANEKTLCATAPLKGFAFAKPEWMKLGEHYGWNADSNMIMLTDMQGFHYFYDPAKNSLSKTEIEIPDYTWAISYLNSSGHFNKEDYVSMKNDIRNKLLYRYEDSTAKFSYVHGELMVDNNPVRDSERKKIYLASLGKDLATFTDSLNAICKTYPKLINEDASYFDLSAKERDLQGTTRDLRRSIDDIKREYKQAAESKSKLIDNVLLSDAGTNFFVVSATDVSDTAKMIITKLNLTDRTFSETWTANMNGFYRDADKANQKGAFETVFSDGNPQFRFTWFDIADGKLVMISQLKMVCLDVNTGKVLWENPL